jgi:hypothetical protein
MNIETYLKVIEILNVLPYKSKSFNNEKFIYWQSFAVTLNQFLEKDEAAKIFAIISSNPYDVLENTSCISIPLAIKIMAIFVVPSTVYKTLNETLVFLENCSCSKNAKELHLKISNLLVGKE